MKLFVCIIIIVTSFFSCVLSIESENLKNKCPENDGADMGGCCGDNIRDYLSYLKSKLNNSDVVFQENVCVTRLELWSKRNCYSYTIFEKENNTNAAVSRNCFASDTSGKILAFDCVVLYGPISEYDAMKQVETECAKYDYNSLASRNYGNFGLFAAITVYIIFMI